MKRSMLWGIVFLIGMVLFPTYVDAKEITLYLFHGDGCPHCKEEIEYLSSIEEKYPNVTFTLYEVWLDEANEALKTDVQKTLGSTSKGVPFTVIGERYFTGFGESTPTEIDQAITYYQDHMSEYRDVIWEVKQGDVKEKVPTETTLESKKELLYSFPIVGELSGTEVEMSSISMLIGAFLAVHPYLIMTMLFLAYLFCHEKKEEDRFRLMLASTLTIGVLYFLLLFLFQMEDLKGLFEGYRLMVPVLFLLGGITMIWKRKNETMSNLFLQPHTLKVWIAISISFFTILFLLGTYGPMLESFYAIHTLQKLNFGMTLLSYGTVMLAMIAGMLLIQTILIFMERRFSNMKIVYSILIILGAISTLIVPGIYSIYF